MNNHNEEEEEESLNDCSTTANIIEEPDGLLLTTDGYHSVGTTDDADSLIVPRRALSSWTQMMHSSSSTTTTTTTTTLLSDNQWKVGSSWIILSSSFVIKFVKLLLLTVVGICLTFWGVRWIGWEHDSQLTLSNIWIYESDLIVRDVVVFFLVARLHQQTGVDHVAWMASATFATLYSSGITSFTFLQHSATLYEMHCTWPLSLWVFTVVLIGVVGILVVWHAQFAVQTAQLGQKLGEVVLAVTLFVLPLMTSSYFHLHHWYAGWLVGMHCNFDVWWSRAVMAWCWGCYMNGIAVYGRDPVLTCDYAMYISDSQHCPFLKCYIDGIHKPTNSSDHVDPMAAPDWRNCSASSYRP